MTTPLERMIDEACGVAEPRGQQERQHKSIEDVADAIALEVLHHIDTMCPAMWQGVAKTARVSLRNHVKKQVVRMFGADSAYSDSTTNAEDQR